jgi:hypothetical protein
MDWFSQLFGFKESDPDSNRARLRMEDETLVSTMNGRRVAVGRFSTPSLAELRAATNEPSGKRNKVTHEAVEDALALHARHPGATIQVASQFNCLEFVGPSVVPEDGVTGYADDDTQGPACALAAAGATVWRHLYVPVDGGLGQTRERQINNLAGLEELLFTDAPLWRVRNGYTFADESQLSGVTARIERADRTTLLGALRIGLQQGVEVTFEARTGWGFVPAAGQTKVTQAFCSALSCAYSSTGELDAWETFAVLVLEGAYEAALRAAALDRNQGSGSGTVWLTFLGGGAFGNRSTWIADAIGRAVARTDHLGLHVRLAHHRAVSERLATMVDEAVELARKAAAL